MILKQNSTKEKGQIVIITPGSPKDWGIEDEVVGHVKRYTQEDMKKIAQDFNIKPIKSETLLIESNSKVQQKNHFH